MLSTAKKTQHCGVDTLNSVSYIWIVKNRDHKVRKVVSRETPSYQLGRYEMQGEVGKRRSVFKVDVHLGEHETAEAALAAWSGEIDHLHRIGRVNQADKLRAKLRKIQELVS